MTELHDHLVLLHCFAHALGVFEFRAPTLFHIDVLLRFSRRDGDRSVHEIRNGNDDCVDILVLDDLLPLFNDPNILVGAETLSSLDIARVQIADDADLCFGDRLDRLQQVMALSPDSDASYADRVARIALRQQSRRA